MADGPPRPFDLAAAGDCTLLSSGQALATARRSLVGRTPASLDRFPPLPSLGGVLIRSLAGGLAAVLAAAERADMRGTSQPAI